MGAQGMARMGATLDPAMVGALRASCAQGEDTQIMGTQYLPTELRAPMPNGRVYYRLRQAVYDRDQGVCWLCQAWVPRHEASLDHALPRALGGGNEVGNLRLAHRRPQVNGCPGNYGRGAGAPRPRGGQGGAVGVSRSW
jgi:hypothetical protein